RVRDFLGKRLLELVSGSLRQSHQPTVTLRCRSSFRCHCSDRSHCLLSNECLCREFIGHHAIDCILEPSRQRPDMWFLKRTSVTTRHGNDRELSLHPFSPAQGVIAEDLLIRDILNFAAALCRLKKRHLSG